MDPVALGIAIRTARIQRGWRQLDVAKRAHCSQAFVSKLERGHLESVRLGDLDRVSRALEVRIELRAWWRGSELARLRAAHHSAMHEVVTRLLTQLGWDISSEVSFNVYGERGVIDALAWHVPTRTLLIVELKTELVDVNNLLETMGRRRRLAPAIVRDRDLAPRVIATWVVVADSRSNRRRLAAHRIVLRTALPHDGRRVHGWLRRPDGPLAALSFLPDIPRGSGGPGIRIVKRVHCRRVTRKAA
jgi:transcriptional regulator with XRE-family HTH domain